jgi:hypothetical protein
VDGPPRKDRTIISAEAATAFHIRKRFTRTAGGST